MIKAVVFDLDDTLFPEMEYVKSGFRAVADFLIRETNKDYYEELIKLFEKDKKDVFDRLIKNNGIKIEVKELIDIYRNQKPTIRFYDDVLPFVNELKAKGIKTGIITDGRPEGQRAKLEALKCYSIFDKIIITDELGGIEYRKPHPLSYEKMAESLNVNYDEMMYIGDNPSKDFGISEVYPIKTVWVKREGKRIHTNEKVLNKPKYIVDDFYQMHKIGVIQ